MSPRLLPSLKLVGLGSIQYIRQPRLCPIHCNDAILVLLEEEIGELRGDKQFLRRVPRVGVSLKHPQLNYKPKLLLVVTIGIRTIATTFHRNFNKQ